MTDLPDRDVQWFNRGACYMCDCDLDPNDKSPRFVPAGEAHLYRGRVRSYMEAVCERDFNMEVAIAEARAERRRFTEVAIGGAFKSYNGDRCPCGAVTMTRLMTADLCVRCWRDMRMLEKQLAVAKFNARLLTTLRKEIAHVKKQSGDDARHAAPGD